MELFAKVGIVVNYFCKKAPSQMFAISVRLCTDFLHLFCVMETMLFLESHVLMSKNYKSFYSQVRLWKIRLSTSKSVFKLIFQQQKSGFGNYLVQVTISPFLTNVPLLYPFLYRKFSDVFRGYRSGTLVENGLIAGDNVMKNQLVFTKFRKFLEISQYLRKKLLAEAVNAIISSSLSNKRSCQ